MYNAFTPVEYILPISEHVFPVYPSAHLHVLLAMQAPLSQGGSQTTLKWITS